MDFRHDPDNNRTAFIEVNARFTGGLATPMAAGFDIPWAIYTLATRNEFTEPVNIKVGTKTKWILGDFIAFVTRLVSFRLSWKETCQMFRFRGFDAYDDFRRDDKKAFWGQMRYYLSKLVKNGKLNP